jgi:hypothetical protein
VGGKRVGVVPTCRSGKLVAAVPTHGAVFQFFSRRGLDFSAAPSAHALCFFGCPSACFGFRLSNRHKKICIFNVDWLRRSIQKIKHIFYIRHLTQPAPKILFLMSVV